MDFPVCPSCGQSVIDDDAADCPFCGSSMKAKPGSKPAPKPAAATSKSPTATKSAATAKSSSAAGSGTRPGTKSGPADDFPFEAEVPGAKTAIQAMPNASKGRTLQVTCPMCETTGYVPPNSVGKDVKCANMKCMVPVFKVPVPVVEAPPPPPPKKSNILVVGGITLVVVAVIGGGIIYVSSQSNSSKPVVKGGLSDEAKAALAEMNAQPAVPPVKPDPAADNKVAPQEDTTTKSATTAKTPDELITAALKLMGESCLKGDRRQRSKPFCRQLAADACIRVGDIKAANEHLSQLMIVGSAVPYFRIEPRLEMFWNDWNAGDKAAATKILDSVLVDVAKLPTVGRTQLEVASRIAAALVLSGQTPKARELLENHQSSLLEGQISARAQMASDGRVSRLTKTHSVLPWSNPQAVAATMSLVVRGQADAGRDWALAQSDVEVKVECLSAWAETVARQQEKPPIDDAVKGLPPALAARVWARAACGRFVAGDKAGATQLLKSAQDLMATVPPPAEPELPALKPLLTYKLPDPAPLIQAATTAAEIAFAHAQFPDHKQQAEESLGTSLAFVRGIAPALPAVAPKLDQADQLGSSGLREMIKKELGIKKDDVADQHAKTYRKVVSDLNDAGERRLYLQVDILSRLIEVGLKEKAWTIVSDSSAAPNPGRRDEFLTTRLVGELLEAFQGTETEKAILGAVPAGTNPPRPAYAVIRQLLKERNTTQAAQYICALDSNSGERDDAALMFATYLAINDKPEFVFALIGKFDDMVLREECYRLSGALLAQRGLAEAVWNQANIVQQATEKNSLCRGMVVGLKAGAAQKELPDPAVGP
ncbi:MAG: hypothetical protein JSS49_19620 [Planctomycetes bacterium]|nr:hypothetical protein [Planctomycetota bacterium]